MEAATERALHQQSGGKRPRATSESRSGRSRTSGLGTDEVRQLRRVGKRACD
jgi:hypothetical protein